MDKYTVEVNKETLSFITLLDNLTTEQMAMLKGSAMALDYVNKIQATA